MAAEWMKLELRFMRSRKVMLAGQDGAWLFLHVVSLVRETRRDGWLPAAELDPEVIAMALAAFGWDVARATDAVAAAAKAGLLETHGERAHIAGWDDSWRPTCSKCRKANRSPDFATCPKCRGVEEEPVEAQERVASARERAQTCAPVRADAPPEQNRAEQSRADGRAAAADSSLPGTGTSVQTPSAVPAPEPPGVARPPDLDPAAAEEVRGRVAALAGRVSELRRVGT